MYLISWLIEKNDSFNCHQLLKWVYFINNEPNYLPEVISGATNLISPYPVHSVNC